MSENSAIEKLFKAGAHFGMPRSRRHPTAKPYIFGAKNKVEIFDLEKTTELLDKAMAFVKEVARSGKQILFVSGKNEAVNALRDAGERTKQPHVAGRWIGGTLTNFNEIRKRVEKLTRLLDEKEKGELSKYTKKERLLIDKDIEDLERMFGGIVSMKERPKALVVIDPRHEEIAVEEARQFNIPIIALAGSDCDLSLIDHPVPANDGSIESISFFLNMVIDAYNEGKTMKPEENPEK